MKQLLQNIQERISQIPEIKYVDENWGQLDYFAPAPPVQFPAVLITLSGGTFTNLGIDRHQNPQHRQQGTLMVEITLAHLKITNSSRQAPQAQKDRAWFVWNMADKVHAVLQGFRPYEKSGAMVREGMQYIQRDDGIQELKLTYSVGLNDV